MAVEAIMIFRTDGLPNGVTSESLGSEMAKALNLSLEPCEDFGLGGPMIEVDLEDLEDDLQHVKLPHEKYIKSGLWLDVNLWKCYFGPGYERGDVQLFVNTAEWLEAHLVHCDIYYGHDCTSFLYPFHREYRTKLLAFHDKIWDLPYRSENAEAMAMLQRARDEFDI